LGLKQNLSACVRREGAIKEKTLVEAYSGKGGIAKGDPAEKGDATHRRGCKGCSGLEKMLRFGLDKTATGEVGNDCLGKD